jgi:hypothetical protein
MNVLDVHQSLTGSSLPQAYDIARPGATLPSHSARRRRSPRTRAAPGVARHCTRHRKTKGGRPGSVLDSLKNAFEQRYKPPIEPVT